MACTSTLTGADMVDGLSRRAFNNEIKQDIFERCAIKTIGARVQISFYLLRGL